MGKTRTGKAKKTAGVVVTLLAVVILLFQQYSDEPQTGAKKTPVFTISAPATKKTTAKTDEKKSTATVVASITTKKEAISALVASKAKKKQPIYMLTRADLEKPKPGTQQVKSAYIDQLIDPKVSADSVTDSAKAEKDSGISPGRLGLEYRYFKSKTTGLVQAEQVEKGVGITLSQQTKSLGTWDLQAFTIDQEQTPGPSQGSGSFLRIQQRDFALSSHWSMDNRAGHIRATAPSLISSSYRYRLPAPIIEGISSTLFGARTSVTITAGDLGQLRGRTFNVFENDNRTGDIAGVSATHRFNKNWRAGLQWWDVNKAQFGTTQSSHTSTAGVLQYHDPDKKLTGQVHFLRNDNGETGLWLDGSNDTQVWQHNYGIFRFDPDLKWLDDTASISNDREGLYMQSRYNRNRIRLGLGIERYETNIDNNPAITGRKVTNTFGSLSYKISRNTHLNGSASLVQQRPGNGLPSANEDTLTLLSNVSHRFGLGTSFWTASFTDRDSVADLSKRYEMVWDHEWKVRSNSQLRTGISYQKEDRGFETLTQTSLRLNTRRLYNSGRIGLDGGLAIAVAGGGITDKGRTSNANFGVLWNFRNKMQTGISLNWNKNVTRLVNGVENTITEKSILATLRYDFSWGKPTRYLGAATGSSGNGTVIGIIFQDKNKNGLQEPGEPGIPNVTVFLDGGYSIETNAEGKFRFWPVPAGKHKLSISQDNVPLPWGLQDDSPQAIVVRTRKQTVMNIPLTNLNE